MKQPQVFYYCFKPLGMWLLLNIVFSFALVWCNWQYPCLLFWPQMQVLLGTCVYTWALWIFKYGIKHKMAVVDDKCIVIDHCAPLFWKDIKSAKEKTVKCGFMKRKVIVLTPKTPFEYKFNWLQKHNCGFTPFSVPLYGIVSKKDIAELKKIFKQKIKQEPKK